MFRISSLKKRTQKLIVIIEKTKLKTNFNYAVHNIFMGYSFPKIILSLLLVYMSLFFLINDFCYLIFINDYYELIMFHPISLQLKN